jgi:hypothetical protein
MQDRLPGAEPHIYLPSLCQVEALHYALFLDRWKSVKKSHVPRLSC